MGEFNKLIMKMKYRKEGRTFLLILIFLAHFFRMGAKYIF